MFRNLRRSHQSRAASPLAESHDMMPTTPTETPTARMLDMYGNHPLHSACDCPQRVKQLLDADPEGASITNDFGVLPLHVAAYQNPPLEVLKMLIDAHPEGVKTKTIDDCGNLPVHRACSNNAPLEVLKILIDAYPEGATIRNKSDCLPLHILARFASPENEKDVQKVKELFQPILNNEEACLFSLPSSGGTPLHIAAKFDLLSLHACARIRNCPPELIVTIARRHPRQVIERDESGRFPLSLAIESGKHWHEGIEAIVAAAQYVITIRDEATHLFPFMLAATRDDSCINTVYGLLRRCPELTRYVTD